VASDADFKVKTFFEVEYMTSYGQSYTNRKLYLTCGVVPCLVTST